MALRHRLLAVAAEHLGALGIVDHRRRRQDRTRLGKALHARGDVHGLPEIVLPLVEVHRQARPFMDADLEQQILAAVRLVQRAHGLAHAQCRRQCMVRREEGRHHRIADSLDHGAALGRDDLVQRAEVLAHQVESHQVADRS
jgi:hypothetical protein